MAYSCLTAVLVFSGQETVKCSRLWHRLHCGQKERSCFLYTYCNIVILYTQIRASQVESNKSTDKHQPTFYILYLPLVAPHRLAKCHHPHHPGWCKIFRVWVNLVTEHTVFCRKFNLLSQYNSFRDKRSVKYR